MFKRYNFSSYLHNLERSQLLRKCLKEVNDLMALDEIGYLLFR